MRMRIIKDFRLYESEYKDLEKELTTFTKQEIDTMSEFMQENFSSNQNFLSGLINVEVVELRGPFLSTWVPTRRHAFERGEGTIHYEITYSNPLLKRYTTARTSFVTIYFYKQLSNKQSLVGKNASDIRGSVDYHCHLSIKQEKTTEGFVNFCSAASLNKLFDEVLKRVPKFVRNWMPVARRSK